MKKFLFLIALIFPFIGFSQLTIPVSTAAELLSSIGPDRTIVLQAGTYNLSESDHPNNKYINWANEYDGDYPVISGLSNMKLTCKGEAKILIAPRYAWVFLFDQCSDLSFDGVTFGHTEGGYCTGGVLGFTDCSNVKIENCHLYGSGTIGITYERSEKLTVKNSEIFECTYSLLNLLYSKDILFDKCLFRNTGEYDLVDIVKCDNVVFKNSIFKENFSSQWFWSTSNFHLFNIDNAWNAPNQGHKLSVGIEVKNCSFINNKVKYYCNNESFITQSGNKFKGNSFMDKQ